MHPRLAELLDYAQLQRVALFEAVAHIPEPMRDRRVEAETWSAAEVLEHLVRVESGIARLITRSGAGHAAGRAHRGAGYSRTD